MRNSSWQGATSEGTCVRFKATLFANPAGVSGERHWLWRRATCGTLRGLQRFQQGKKKFFATYPSSSFEFAYILDIYIYIYTYIYIYDYICTDEQSTTDFRLTFQALAVARWNMMSNPSDRTSGTEFSTLTTPMAHLRIWRCLQFRSPHYMFGSDPTATKKKRMFKKLLSNGFTVVVEHPFPAIGFPNITNSCRY